MLCPSCKSPLDPSEYDIFSDNLSEPVIETLFKKTSNSNCDTCGGLGTLNPKPYIEFREVTTEDLEFIRNENWDGWRHFLVKNGVEFVEQKILTDVLGGDLCAIEKASEVRTAVEENKILMAGQKLSGDTDEL